MYIDRVLNPIETLGPGKRLVIWTKGCSKHCNNCANPELWDTSTATNYDVEKIEKIIRNIYLNDSFDGVTISGGDPLEQKEDILALLKILHEMTEDIIVYTGYTFEELQKKWNENEINELKSLIAVLIDGPYVDKLNAKECVLRGSSNQRIIFFKDKYREIYENYMNEGRKIQNVFMNDKMISVGIHNRKDEQDEEA